jgi:hypothetical protein
MEAYRSGRYYGPHIIEIIAEQVAVWALALRAGSALPPGRYSYFDIHIS